MCDPIRLRAAVETHLTGILATADIYAYMRVNGTMRKISGIGANGLIAQAALVGDDSSHTARKGSQGCGVSHGYIQNLLGP